MSFNSCILSEKLTGKINSSEMRDVAAQYEKQGLPSEQALQRAVEDKLELALMDEKRIVAAVRSAWEAQGGKMKKPRTAKAQAAAPTVEPEQNDPLAAQRERAAWIPAGELKTYTPKEAEAEWKRSSAGFKRAIMGRVGRQSDDPITAKDWADLTPAERKLMHAALNEDFYTGAWYTTPNGTRVTRNWMPKPAEKTAEQLADEAGAARWEALDFNARESFLYSANIGINQSEAGQAKFSPWDKMGLDFRKQLIAAWDRKDAAAAQKQAAAQAPIIPTPIEGDKPAPTNAEMPAELRERGAGNKIFTQDAAEKARARLRSKLGRLNSGIDPELFQDGIILAGYHIEAGARSFAAYTKAMLEDLGENVRPYLRSFYEGVRHYPGIDGKAMSTGEEIDAYLAAEAAPLPEAIKKVVGTAPKVNKKAKAGKGNPTLRGDYGVEHIDGYTETDEFPAGPAGDYPTGGVKDAFLKDAARYLKAVEAYLAERGFEPTLDRKGKPMKAVSTNPGGPAVAGDAMLSMFNPGDDRGIYVSIGASMLGRWTPTTQSNLSVMMRTTTNGGSNSTGGNQWMPVDLSAHDLGESIVKAVARAAGTNSGKLENNASTKEQNGQSNAGREGAGSLDEVAAPGSGRAGSSGGAERGDAGSGRTGNGSDLGSDEESQLPGARGSGSGDAGVHSAATGGTGGRRLGGGRARGNGSRVSGPDEGPGAPGVTPAAPNIPAVNFRITDDLRLGQGGEVEKFNDNIAAIRTMKAIEGQKRRATAEEQAILARYVGWGGLANAFPNPQTGEFKDAWGKRGPELAELLSPKEYALARRSTLDSHYTSETVVRSMWDAARRLGYKGGLALESSMGVGNFLGLMPLELANNSRFVGVEYDSITARIATLLYPGETVLNSGFQSVPLPDGAFDLAIGNPPFGEQSLRFQFKPELNGHSIHNQFFLGALDALKPGGLQVQVVSRYLLDKADKSSRVMLAKRARLLGAIRLPDTAFKENARTEVVTDIVFLQRLTPAEQIDMEAAFAAAAEKPSRDREKEFERQRLLALIPDWVNTASVRDPLGGDPMTVNRYFASNPDMILGELERSGSMKHGADITVRLDKSEDLSARLAAAIAKLPEGVMVQDQQAIDASKARHKDMSDALRIALAGHENGSIKLEAGGVLEQVMERETPEGGYELSKRTLTATSPWHESLLLNSEGKWYTLEVKLDDDGKPVKQMKGDKATKLNVYERRVYESEAEIPSTMLLGETRYGRLKELVQIRDLLKEQLVMESENAQDAAIEDNRAQLAAGYNAFVKKHGLISESANSALVSTMPDGALVQALEFGYRPAITAAKAARSGEKVRAASATPAPILSERVIVPYESPTSADSLADAIAINTAETGRVDLERLASLLGRTVAEVEAEVNEADRPLLFNDPESGQWETRADYLTGQVKRKLAAARQAGLSKNVVALEDVQPEPWGAESVTALLGSNWVPAGVYADFAEHITGSPARVAFSALTNSYSVNAGNMNRANEEEWSSDGYTAAGLISDLLNSSQIKVTYRDADGKTHVDGERTALALLKAKAITAEWADWVYKDGDRRRKLVEIFNEKFNTRVPRQHDGSHLVLPGKVPDAVIGMRRHQKNAIWRGITERFMLVDHTVGAGKTFTAIARAMERRRMGLSKKPAIIVPNHMVEQFAADVYRLYPGAKVLAAGKKDFEKSRRRKLFAKIATGDFDIVIIPHSSFGFIGIAPETEERYLQHELNLAKQAVEDAQEEAEANGEDNGFRKPFGVKEAERLVEKITQRMEKVQGDKSKDRLITFEQMGIDDMTIDEAHEFKNLYYSSRLTGVKGMGNKTGSQKAFDLYNKVRVLRESPTGTVTFMTGTPISNSAVEMYNMMRYLAADELAELGLEHFDAWRAQYVSTDAGWEPNETGRLKEVNRLGRTWSNMRSLMDLYYSFTDVVDNDAIKVAYAEDNDGAEFPLPRVVGGDRQSVIIQPTKAQIALLEDVLDGFDALPDIKDPQERNATRLRLMDRARKVSLDVRAAEPKSTSDEKGGKLEIIADNVKRIYDKWTADKGTQLIFLDRSVPKSKGDDAILKEYDALIAEQRRAFAEDDEAAQRRTGEKLERFDPNEMEELRNAQAGGWSAYQQIKDNLIARGIPANEIRFVQEAQNDAQKKALFDAVNSGEIRVLIGSTPRMGAGTNVQERLVGLHHADVTWKPSDIEQREGRIIRQGNELLDKYGIGKFEVEILAYATERTIDAKMWSLNSSKLKTINAIRKYDGAFSMDFEDEDSVSMAELAALASGDPLLLERVKLMSEIDKLELLKRQHSRKAWGIKSQIEDAQRDIANLPRRIEATKEDAVLAKAGMEAMLAGAEGRKVTVEGKEYTSGTEARKAVYESFKAQGGEDAEPKKVSISVGKRRLTSLDGAMAAVGSEMGDEQTFSMLVGDEEHIGRTDAARELAELAYNNAIGLDKGESVSVDAGMFRGLKMTATVERESYSGMYIASIAVLRPDGSTLASDETSRREDPRFNTASMRSAVEGLDKLMKPDRFDWAVSNLNDRLERSTRQLPELLERTPGEFPQQGELDAKNDRLETVIRELASGPSTPARKIVARNPLRNVDGSYRRQAPAPGLYRRPGQSVITATDKMLSVEAITAEIQKRIEQFAHQPRIVIRDNGVGVVPGATANSGIMGATYKGTIYLFRDALPDLTAVQETLFHELVHYGIRRYMTEDEYISTMLQLYHSDDSVRGYSDSWVAAPDGQKWVKARGIEYARAVGVDEYLAYLAEPNAGIYQKTDLKNRVIAAVTRWLGRLAARMGMPRVSAWLYKHKSPEARDLIQSLFKRLENDTPPRDPWIEGGFQYRQGEGRANGRTSEAKSAAGNTAELNPEVPDVRFRRAGLAETLADAANRASNVQLPGNYLVADLFNQSGTVSWWHKTVGTMDNLARRSPAFSAVYEAVQSFLGDVSRFATVAADLAPTLLPQLDSIRDVLGKNRKKALTAADTKAIGAPIFEGTLIWARDAHDKPVKVSVLEEQAAAMTIEQKAEILLQKGIIDDEQNQSWLASPLDFYDATIERRYTESELKPGIVWTDDELRSMFNLDERQIGLYREFRAATDKSLTNLAISEMIKLGGKDADGMLEDMLNKGDVGSAGELLRDHFIMLAQQDPEKQNMHLDTARQIMDVVDKVELLIERGYAPLSRFGKFTVYVQERNEEGEMEQVYFGMFESQFEASRMARQMRKDHPEADVQHGTVSDQVYKLFAGVSPETIELFGSMVGLDAQADNASTEVYQTYLKVAKNNRSAMKRMIQRKGIAGFSEDAGRVLANFIYSNARLTAGNTNLGTIDEAVTKIPKQEGQLTDAAMELRDFIKDPDGGGNKLGGLMFAQFLGGSVASAMVNLTQPFAMTLPFLSQWGGIAKAGKQLGAAIRDAGKDSTGDPLLDGALKWATEEGIVAPQEVHYLQAQAAGKGALQAGDGTKLGDARATLNNTKSKVMLGWGKLFALAELANRRITFIAAYRTAVEQGMAHPARFAQDAVSQTQGTYNSGNRPKWARNAVGGLLLTFKQYSIAYLELLTRMMTAGAPGSKERKAGQRAALYMIAVLFLLGGADGLPFEQDLEDAIDGILQRLGYNFSTKRAKQEFLTEALGEGGADFALKGISSLPGMPIDVSGRFGMGNLIPGTGLLTKKESYSRDIGELAGPAGDLAKRAFTATGHALGGDIAGAALEISPVAVRNLAKGTDMLATDSYRDARGYKINDTTGIEAGMKILGFQPNSTADIQDAKGQALNMISQARMRSKEISEHWAQGIASNDPAKVQEAREWRDDWNRKNPESRISVNMPALMKRVRSMRADAINRTAMTAPKALKQTVRNELEEIRE